MKVDLYPFQYVGAYKLFSEERFLLADEMGMFKTSQAIFANSKFRERKPNLRTLIMCPASVREHWARELQQFAYPVGDVNVVEAKTADMDIRRARNATWTILHYGLAPHLGDELSDRLRNIGFHHLILDEVHNAKNPRALRTRMAKSISDQADYVSLLSGTPIPNSVVDLYTLMSLIDPDEYELDPDDIISVNRVRSRFLNRYFNDPQMVKALFHRKMLRRRASEFIADRLPELNIEDVYIELEGPQLDQYMEVLGYESKPGRKIMDLEMALTDPSILDEDFKGVSGKYEAIDRIVRSETRRGGKVLVFTNLKEDVTDVIAERYARLKPVVITGDITISGGKREQMRQRFQKDPKCRMMIATTVMNEGVDCTAANAVVNLMLPWTPAEYLQRYKRAHRSGEIRQERVNVYNLIGTIPMEQPSLDIARKDMLDAKQRFVNYLLSGIVLSREELRELEDGERVPRIVKAIRHPSQAILEYYVRWRGIGDEKARRQLRRDPDAAKFIADLYPNFVMAKNAANVYVPLIRDIERRVRHRLSPKVDICCGPGMLGHHLDERTVGIDIMKEHLDKGKEFHPDNLLIQGSATSLPLPDNYAGLVVCSLAFQMLDPVEGRNRALNEMSRILKKRGETYALIVMISNYMDGNNRRKFERAVKSAGLDIVENECDLGPSRLETFLLGKVASKEPIYEPIDLTFIGDKKKKRRR